MWGEEGGGNHGRLVILGGVLCVCACTCMLVHIYTPQLLLLKQWYSGNSEYTCSPDPGF